MEPKISVALPVYNGANFLREALDSVLAQTFGDFELVVSDNCSTDETPQILEDYTRRDARVRVSRSEKFLAQADNVNRSVALCNTEWVKLFCHDDLLKPWCLETLQRATIDSRAGTVGVIGNGEDWLFENGYLHTTQKPELEIPEVVYWQGTELLRKNLAASSAISLPALTTATVRKEAWLDCGGFDKRFSHFDVFLWTEMLLRWDYLVVCSVLTTNRIHSGQVAVAARRSLKSIEDHRLFWREFLDEHGNELQVGARSEAFITLRPVSIAGSAIAIHWLKGNYRTGLGIFAHLPVSWWPLLPPITLRNLARERKKINDLRKRVPLEQIYPG